MTLDGRHQVDMPSSGISIRHINNSHPVYYSIPGSGYRNAQGTPTKSRECIGKLDPETGKLIPNVRYWDRFGWDPAMRLVPAYESVRLIGGAFLVDSVMGRLGLVECLDEALGVERSQLARTAALYMTARGNVFDGALDYCQTNTFGEAPLSSRIASRFFATITPDERMDFFKNWVARHPPNPCLAYDVTSFSTNAKKVADREHGYDRDGDRIPQINLGCYVSRATRLPLFYVAYPGPMVDKSRLPEMMEHNDSLGVTDAGFVMGGGFCSTANIKYLARKPYDFVIGVETRHKTALAALEHVRPEISKPANRIGPGLFSMSSPGVFYGAKATMHIYFDRDLARSQTDILYRAIEDQEARLAQKRTLTPWEVKEYNERFAIVLTSDGGFTFKRDMDKIERLGKYRGYFCLLSNTSLDSVEVLAMYRRKDVIEESFVDLKNYISMERSRAHDAKTTDGKLFCAFIALIVASEIGVRLGDYMRRNRMSEAGLLMEMDKICVGSDIRGWRLLNPLTKTQRTIMENIGLTEKDLGLYLKKD